jgi:hypothetical protein
MFLDVLEQSSYSLLLHNIHSRFGIRNFHSLVSTIAAWQPTGMDLLSATICMLDITLWLKNCEQKGWPEPMKPGRVLRHDQERMLAAIRKSGSYPFYRPFPFFS